VSRISRSLIVAGALAVTALAIVPVAQAEQGDWLLKGGATMVSPKSKNLKLGDLGPVPGVGTVTGASLEVDDGTSFGFTVTYMYTDNWGVELLAAVPFKHDIKLAATIDGSRGSVKIAETKHIPPTLSLQYHFMPDQTFSPYVGAGVNWTLFSSEKIDSTLANKLSLSDSFGVAAQVGADLHFGSNWFANLDVRYIQIETDAKITDDVGTTKLGKVKVNPIVYSIMLGYRF
jgi:outer membrane protein